MKISLPAAVKVEKNRNDNAVYFKSSHRLNLVLTLIGGLLILLILLLLLLLLLGVVEYKERKP